MPRQALRAPSFARRIACAVYESLILAALVLVATFPYLALAGDSTGGLRRHLLQAWVVLVVGAYLVGFWTRSGQTLAMKTWHIRLESAEGGPVSLGSAVRRYFLALLGATALGLGFLWAIVDRDRQFLHDRLAGTRLSDTRSEPGRG